MKKDSVQGLDILEYDGVGFDKTVVFDGWRVCFLNQGEKFTKDTVKYLERHLCTDEVFVLLKGKATLIIGKELDEVELSECKIYNVKKNIWHAIYLEKDAKVLVIENSDTTKENSEYYYF